MDANAIKHILKEQFDEAFSRIQISADTINTNVRESLEQAQDINQRLDSILATFTQASSPKDGASEEESTNDDSAMEQTSGNEEPTEQESAHDGVSDEKSADENTDTAIDLAALTKQLQGAASLLDNWSHEKPTEIEKFRMVSLAQTLNTAAKALQVDLHEAQGYLDMIEKDASEDHALKEWQRAEARLYLVKVRAREVEGRIKQEKKATEKARKNAQKRERRRKKRREEAEKGREEEDGKEAEEEAEEEAEKKAAEE